MKAVILAAGVGSRLAPLTNDRPKVLVEVLGRSFLFRQLDEFGYDGWIGCEYRPRGVTEDGLGWLATAMKQGGQQ